MFGATAALGPWSQPIQHWYFRLLARSHQEVAKKHLLTLRDNPSAERTSTKFDTGRPYFVNYKKRIVKTYVPFCADQERNSPHIYWSEMGCGQTHFMSFLSFSGKFFFSFPEIIKQKSANVPDSLRDAYISYAVLLTPAVGSWNYAQLQMRFRHGDLHDLLVTGAQLWSPTYKIVLSHVASVGLSEYYLPAQLQLLHGNGTNWIT